MAVVYRHKSKKNIGALILKSISDSKLLHATADALIGLDDLGLLKTGKYYHQKKHYAFRKLRSLESGGLISLVKIGNGGLRPRLTEKGRQELSRYELGLKSLKRPWHWDGKYRLVIFDIKEWKRGTRDELRGWLEHLGFVRLQNSVWVYPYDCQDILTLLKAHFKIGQEVLYITATSIENDKWLKREFGL